MSPAKRALLAGPEVAVGNHHRLHNFGDVEFQRGPIHGHLDEVILVGELNQREGGVLGADRLELTDHIRAEMLNPRLPARPLSVHRNQPLESNVGVLDLVEPGLDQRRLRKQEPELIGIVDADAKRGAGVNLKRRRHPPVVSGAHPVADIRPVLAAMGVLQAATHDAVQWRAIRRP